SEAYKPTTQGVIERANGTISHKIYDAFVRNGNHRWVDLLDALVDNYNDSIQSTTKQRPADLEQADVTDQERGRQSIPARVKRYLKEGDSVRISLLSFPKTRRHRFAPFQERWTRDVYSVEKVLKPTEFRHAFIKTFGPFCKLLFSLADY